MSSLVPFIKVLFLEANPKDLPPLHLDEEVRKIDNTLKKAKYRDRFKIETKRAVRNDEFEQAILDFKPRIVHFSGHGADSRPKATSQPSAKRQISVEHDEDQGNTSQPDVGGLYFVDESGNSKFESGNALAEFFKALPSRVECVVLNSCYTEKTAKKLNEHVRYVVGMNQAIGDKAAIEFSTGFYKALGAGLSIEEAYKIGCRTIELEGIPEGLTPVIKINPKIPALPYYNPFIVAYSSFTLAVLIIVLRFFGLLQGLEIGFYDHLITGWSRNADSQLLIVEATQEDVQQQIDRGETVKDSFSNTTLANLIARLNELDPIAIGLDVYRERPLGNSGDDKKLKNLFRNQENLFAVCKLQDKFDRNTNIPEVPPPPDFPPERVGFSDFVPDDGLIIRRQLLGLDPKQVEQQIVDKKSKCRASNSLNLILANYALQKQDPDRRIDLDTPQNKFCQVRLANGSVLPSVHPFTGGYQGLGDAYGCQVLLKYRVNHSTKQAAETVTVEEVLSPDFDSSKYKDRVILIGVTRQDGARDYWSTPYNDFLEGQMPGVKIQGQMISQLIDAAQGEASLIRALPQGAEAILILMAALLGGLIVWRIQAPFKCGTLFVCGGAGYLVCFVLFQASSWWLPFVPIAFALAASPYFVRAGDQINLILYQRRNQA